MEIICDLHEKHQVDCFSCRSKQQVACFKKTSNLLQNNKYLFIKQKVVCFFYKNLLIYTVLHTALHCIYIYIYIYTVYYTLVIYVLKKKINLMLDFLFH